MWLHLALASLCGQMSGTALPPAAIVVDSMFPGYSPDVLTDGRWYAPGEEPAAAWNAPESLGNAANTWVSGEAAGIEHWVRLDWSDAVTINRVDVWWSLTEWYPRAFRAEVLGEGEWEPLVPGIEWLTPSERHTALTFAPVTTRALRLIQHPHGGGERDLLALQELAALWVSEAAEGVQGAVPLRPGALARLEPREIEANIARLFLEQPGAAQPMVWDSRGGVSAMPELAEASADRPVALDGSTVAVGVVAPLQHVVDSMSIALADAMPASGSVRPEFLAGGRWRPITASVLCERDPVARALRFTFEPTAAAAFRMTLPRKPHAIASLEVHRYSPPNSRTWPQRLTRNRGLEDELLARDEEPSLELLASCALSMRPARALLGLKNDAREYGVTWDGQLVAERPTTLTFGSEGALLSDAPDTVTRRLLDGWRPCVIVEGRLGDLAIGQCAFVSFRDDERASPAMFLRVEASSASGAAVASEVEVGGVRCELAAPPGEVAVVDLVSDLGPTLTFAPTDGLDDALVRFTRYWDEQLAGSSTIALPEDKLNDAVKAVLAQLLINADGDIMPYGAAPSIYDGALFGIEESYAMLGLAFFGLTADAERTMDATYLTPEFVQKVDEYTDLAYRHQQYRNGLEPMYAAALYRLTGNQDWIRKHLPLLLECADWTMEARRTTMVAEGGGRPLHWGLLPEWVYGGDIGDLRCYALFANVACWRGLNDTAWLLRDLGEADRASVYQRDAEALKALIDAAADASYRPDHAPPVMPLRLYAAEPVGDDYYQLFAGVFLELMPFSMDSALLERITAYMEGANLQFCMMPRFRRDVGPGGLDGLYGLGYLLTLLHQDRIDEFLIGLYGYLAFNMERDSYVGRETNVIYASDLHIRSRYPIPDSSDPLPCGSAVFLHLLRHLLVTEAFDGPGQAPTRLQLLRGAPRAWFEEGKTIRFESLPTAFGPVTCEVTSHPDQGRIQAFVRVPDREPCEGLELRLRHPKGLRPRSVRVNGALRLEFDPARETISLPGTPGEYRVVVSY